MRETGRVNPRTDHCHYSNPLSQNSLICETPEFPHEYNEEKQNLTSAYSDRIQGWDSKRFKEACDIAGTGDQGWSRALPRLGFFDLKRFAVVALDLPSVPVHVRIIHHFNVSTGYSCPVVQAICNI